MTLTSLYVSTVEKSVDAKGRVSVPPAFRAILSKSGFDGLYARAHRREAALECGTQEWLADMRGRQDGLDPDSDEFDDATYLFVAATEALTWDPEGRVTLPRKFLDLTGISQTATFVGMKSHFEIWEPKAFARRLDQAKTRMSAKLGRGVAQ